MIHSSDMNIITMATGVRMQRDIISAIEEQIGRELTPDERRIAYIASQKGLIMGCRYGRGD